VRIESRTNLLFSFEKMALRDAVKSPAGARSFSAGLYDLLHGTGSMQKRFERWVSSVEHLPRKQTRVLTWPLVTVFGFIAEPETHFFLKPNGVFLVSGTRPRVVESSEYPALSKGVRLATQSGPLLLRRGRVHPALIPNSDSRKIRNGVGVSGHTAIFVISEDPVNFYEFALYFRDVLHCRDALYLDGTVSALHSLALRRTDFVRELGPILGVVVP